MDEKSPEAEQRDEHRSLFSARYLHETGLDLILAAGFLLLVIVLLLRLVVDA